MLRKLTTGGGQIIYISGKSIASGGEGSIFPVIKPTGMQQVVKIYNTTKKAAESKAKIEFMIKNSPTTNHPQIIRNAIVWPLECVYENRIFVGYTMPFIKDAIKLTNLTLPSPPQRRNGIAWKKFDHAETSSLLRRIKLAYNLSQAINVLHSSNKYVIVDLKPDNILLKPDGHFYIIDLDSIQISHGNKLLFQAKALTEDYAPPEFFNNYINPKKDKINVYWDHFSFAVIVYALLFGIHPFQASHHRFTDLPDLIRNGLFANGSNASKLHVIPHLHKRFGWISPDLRKLFIDCFEKGFHYPTYRPDIGAWSKLLMAEIRKRENHLAQAVITKTPSPAINGSESLFKDCKIGFNGKEYVILWHAPDAMKVILDGNAVPVTGNKKFQSLASKYEVEAIGANRQSEKKIIEIGRDKNSKIIVKRTEIKKNPGQRGKNNNSKFISTVKKIGEKIIARSKQL